LGDGFGDFLLPLTVGLALLHAHEIEKSDREQKNRNQDPPNHHENGPSSGLEKEHEF